MKTIKEFILKQITSKMEKEDEKYYIEKKEIEGIQTQFDIVYGDGYTMDYHYTKEIPMKQVIVIDIHGGGWVYGDKRLNRHFCMHIAKEGYPIYNINYGLAPTYSVKQQVQQIIKAIRCVQRRHTNQTYKLCLCGDSAGAHLASLVTCIIKCKTWAEDYEVDTNNIHIDGLLLQHGIYDLTSMRSSKKIYMKTLYQWMFPKKDEVVKEHDCLMAYIDATWDVPLFLLSSTGDRMFSSQTKNLVNQLDHLHRTYTALFWDKEELQHVFHISFPDKEESRQSFQAMVQFLSTL